MRTKWVSKSSLMTRLYTKPFKRLQMLKFKKEISLYYATLWSPLTASLEGSLFFLQKDDKADHLKNKESFRTTKA